MMGFRGASGANQAPRRESRSRTMEMVCPLGMWQASKWRSWNRCCEVALMVHT